MARKTKKTETVAQKLERWLAGQAKTTSDQQTDIREQFEAGSDGYITVDGENFERFWLDDSRYVVVSWDDGGYVGIC